MEVATATLLVSMTRIPALLTRSIAGQLCCAVLWLSHSTTCASRCTMYKRTLASRFVMSNSRFVLSLYTFGSRIP